MLDTLAPIAARVGAILLERRQTIAVADGATGGLILAGLLTMAGATRFCRGGGVVYSLRGRDILLGLPREQLVGMESVTEAYALVQADAIRQHFRADWGVAESGAAGPDQHPRGAPAGRTCIAVSGPGVAVTKSCDTGSNDRIANMGAFAQAALTFLVDTLEAAAASKEE
ncbi:CinA family protein [Sphingomonas mucosissima]|uniref:Putative competence-damage inducible protein n=1 Tax=Sphingomonas mucosissima TaxID=370959 RepID=A0A245ZFF8_9SPHN|nr:CinA family protein [Sphingomonas mucosissima]OWK28480.1 putative competence-damage inducible protein [Sphingomonas mucosissima]